MKIDTQHTQNGVMLKLDGELDANTALNVDKNLNSLIEAGSVNILVDCARLEYISSAGIGVFIAHLEDIDSKNGKIVFFGLNDAVSSVLEMLGIDQIINICKGLDEAKELFD